MKGQTLSLSTVVLYLLVQLNSLLLACEQVVSLQQTVVGAVLVTIPSAPLTQKV
jgi:hypothetical protein